MKTTGFLLFLLLLSSMAKGQMQTTICTIGTAIECPSDPTLTDTVNSGDCICLDSSVVSFTATIITGGIVREYTCTGHCFSRMWSAKSGDRIFLQMIIAEPQQGVRVKQPVKTFYVR